MYDYGNARIAAHRERLLGPDLLERLAESGSPSAAAAELEVLAGWGPLVEAARETAREPRAVLEVAVERHRAAELGALRGWYTGPQRRLVEALVMGLDRDRVVAILRRRRAGQTGDEIAPSVLPGAILDGAALVELARRRSLADAILFLGKRGILSQGELAPVLRLARQPDAGEPAELEAALDGAWMSARRSRATGPGADAEHVRRLLDEEMQDRRKVADEMEAGGPDGAALVERCLILGRADRLARAAHRDPLGIEPAVGYVAAIEAETVRLRVIINRLAAGWSRHIAAAYLGATVP